MGLSIIECNHCRRWFGYDPKADIITCPECGAKYYSEKYLESHPETEIGKRWKEQKHGM